MQSFLMTVNSVIVFNLSLSPDLRLQWQFANIFIFDVFASDVGSPQYLNKGHTPAYGG